jgi:hypothetical protein
LDPHAHETDVLEAIQKCGMTLKGIRINFGFNNYIEYQL